MMSGKAISNATTKRSATRNHMMPRKIVVVVARSPTTAVLFDAQLSRFAQHAGRALVIPRITAFVEHFGPRRPGALGQLLSRRPPFLGQSFRRTHGDAAADARAEQDRGAEEPEQWRGCVRCRVEPDLLGIGPAVLLSSAATMSFFAGWALMSGLEDWRSLLTLNAVPAAPVPRDGETAARYTWLACTAAQVSSSA
jgi:hypothetical protein